MRTLFILLILLAGMLVMAQKITLQDCHNKAIEQYPNLKQLNINQEVYENNIKNVKRNYYPSLNLNGQAHYQSDVTKIPESPLPAFDVPEISKDWYKLNLDVEQMIFDGGVTAGQKKVELAKHEISDQKIQVELYRLKERINHLFFNIIFLKKNIEILEVLYKNLNAQVEEMEIAYDNGIILSTDVDAIKVELYKTDQKIIEKKADVSGLIASLNELTKLGIDNTDDLIEPELSIDNYNFVNNRPEYILFNKQQSQLVAMKSLAGSKRLPVLMAFGQLGYGRPGYDMLNDNFDDYYMIGARLHWNIWDWGKVKREKQIFDLQNEIIISQKETFDQNLKADLHQRIAGIEKYEKIIGSDEIIVKLQQNVVNTSENQFKNGTITSTNYLIEVNKMVSAKLNLEAHKLQLVFAKYQYLTAIGDL